MNIKFNNLTMLGIGCLICVVLFAFGCNTPKPEASNPAPVSTASKSTANIPSQVEPQDPTNASGTVMVSNSSNSPKVPSVQKSNDVSKPSVTTSQNTLESRRLYPLDSLQVVYLTCDGHRFPVWVMDNQGKAAEGLMDLKDSDIPNNHGMLFISQTPSVQSFWMDNTYIPLDIVFISPEGKVLNRVVGKKLDRTPLYSKGNALYVIELKAGEAGPLGLNPGATVTIPKSLVYKNF